MPTQPSDLSSTQTRQASQLALYDNTNSAWLRIFQNPPLPEGRIKQLEKQNQIRILRRWATRAQMATLQAEVFATENAAAATARIALNAAADAVKTKLSLNDAELRALQHAIARAHGA